MLRIALSKGRIFKETLPLLKAADIVPAEDPESSRKLILPTNHDDVSLIIIRASDVPTFIEYGAADIGIAGKDILLEHGGQGMNEVLDLQIAKCKLMVAGYADKQQPNRRVKVATKFSQTTRRYYAEKGQQVELIKLYGSMELAPIVGLADYIVDVVDTGNTLRANGLEPLEHIMDISSRLVVNKAAAKTKAVAINKFVEQIAAAVQAS